MPALRARRCEAATAWASTEALHRALWADLGGAPGAPVSWADQQLTHLAAARRVAAPLYPDPVFVAYADRVYERIARATGGWLGPALQLALGTMAPAIFELLHYVTVGAQLAPAQDKVLVVTLGLLQAAGIIRRADNASLYAVPDALQLAAAAEFAHLERPWCPPRAGPALDALLAEDGAAFRAFLRAQYAATQAWLQAHGIRYALVWRGLRGVPAGCAPCGFQRATAALNPFTSWCLRPELAWRYAGRGADDVLTDTTPEQPRHPLRQIRGTPAWSGTGSGAVLATLVPAARMLAVVHTGAASVAEAEVVVLAGPTDCWALTWDRPDAPETAWTAAQFRAAAECYRASGR
jgi:hypothetical protein